MNFRTCKDCFLNVFLPLLTGLIVYIDADFFSLPSSVRNYFPDGLWAYAFVSCMLIIWKRNIPVFWLLAIATLFISYEILQYIHFINGTGDAADVATYFLSLIIALHFNTFFKTHYYIP